jgi:hypothetical protein
MPTCWAANGITVVVPPSAAEVVADWNVSAFIRPEAASCSMWQWLSTPPGVTIRPLASISLRPIGRSRAIATIVSFVMPTSASNTAVSVATRPPLITRSQWTMPRDSLYLFGSG